MNQINYLLLAALGVAIGAAGYFAGKSGNQPSATPIQPIQPIQPQAEQTIPREPNTQTPQTPAITPEEKPTTQAPQKRAITSEEIAKAKNVPATLKNSQGDFSLVAVVEGADANRRFNKSLQIVRAQRQRLDLLSQRLALISQQIDLAPAESVQQRELIAGQIKETRKALEGNLRFMSQNYAYSLKNNYILVRHEVSLLSMTEEDGDAKSEVVHEFKNSESYEDFKKKRDVYLRLKLEQAAAQAAAKAKADAPPAAVLVKGGKATPVKLKPTPEMDEKSKELQRLYKYDPEKNYQINFEKTALYARAKRASQPVQTIPKKSNTKTPQKRLITPEEIAKAKNVPAILNTPQGIYTLVAVVEGGESNRILSRSLQVAGAQRQRLAAASQQFEKTPASSVQQRELIAGQINEIKKEMEDNLRFMARKYGYSLKNNYTKVPHVVSLLSVTKIDDEAKAESVYVFKNPGDYNDFQKKRDAYLRLKVEQARAAKKKAKLAPTPEMNVKSKELQRLYKYDPEKTYQIRIEKSALYARAAR